MEYGELLKLYGPLSLGWIVAAYLGKFILDRYDRDIEAKTALSLALQKLAEEIKDIK
tara:strand:- start:362 stop:532 length:171 start_codon:yes stop_codon:yes gene_type:complete